MRKIFPILLVITGMIIGGGTGYVLRLAEKSDLPCHKAEDSHGCELEESSEHAEPVTPDSGNLSYAKLTKQFVVPVVKDRKVSALVVMSLSIETNASTRDVVFEREPKLRDALLAVMFLHANSGGFEGQFTGGETMKDLRGSMLEAARRVIGQDVYNVLVTDILRQDV